jgi:hypothetical protein
MGRGHVTNSVHRLTSNNQLAIPGLGDELGDEYAPARAFSSSSDELMEYENSAAGSEEVDSGSMSVDSGWVVVDS